MSKLQTPTVLSTLNKHERDTYIEFFESGHKYKISIDPNAKYTSVTSWVHTHFPPFNADNIIRNMMSGKNWKEGHKYWGMTPEEIKKAWNSASSEGTGLHYNIECFMNQSDISEGYTHKELLDLYQSKDNNMDSPEWNYFIQFVRDTPYLKPFRTEWMVFHEELKIAGSIDMVYELSDGTLAIYDWKRCLEITSNNRYNKFATTKVIAHYPDTNFWHYALQLNVYKTIIEQKYGKTVSELCLIRLHPNSDNYEKIVVPILVDDITKLFEERKNMLIESYKT
jgi:ATP-dependent exoDNAse (exonuclease V) beta subunit